MQNCTTGKDLKESYVDLLCDMQNFKDRQNVQLLSACEECPE